ncbi:MAG TPA: PKD domain-containing protein [Flavobacteriales bacterium]|nr:PKD domain-containing protein [Flavobacteriales bacterium]HIA11032.1 PKD domain-containing protein [Flavobacteriales bacterium]HIO72626.1 PKD domain-containing protein [Flavobacteriales bacterium]
MGKFSVVLAVLCLTFLPLFTNAQVFFYEDFENGCASDCSANGYNGSNGSWVQVSTGTNGSDNNPWYVSCAENGNPAGSCGSGCGSDESLHIGSNASIFGDVGAAYLNGGSGFFFPETNLRIESPTIDCSGRANISVCFDYMERGSGTLDDATFWYNDGSTWTQIDPLAKTALGCSPQGTWTAFTMLLPSSADNNANVKLGFNWTNNDDNAGDDPTIAIDDIILSTLPAQDTVIGDTIVCVNDLGIPYYIPFNTGSTYFWSVQSGGGVIVAGQGTDSILIDWGGIPGSYKLDVTETNCSGTVSHIGFIVTVIACSSAPIASFTVSDTTVCAGQCIDFFDASTNCSACNWNWQFPGSITGSAIGAGPHNICYNTPGIYDVNLIVTDGNTSISDDTVSIGLIQVYPDVSFDAESDTSMCEGDSVDLNINNLIGGLPVDSFVMTFTSQFTYTTTPTVNGGIYYLVVSGTYWGATGELRDGAFKFENLGAPITPIPSSVWKLDGSAPGQPCPTAYDPNHQYYFYFTGTGSGITFTFDDTNYSDNGGSLNFKIYYLAATSLGISWSTGDNEPCITVAPAQTTTYTVTVRNNTGDCSDSNFVTVTVVPPISISAGPDTSFCSKIGVFSLANATIGSGGMVTNWQSTGDGTFDNPMTLNPNYTLGSLDSLTGTVDLIIEGVDSLGLCPSVFDTMTLTLSGAPPTIDSTTTIDASGCGMADGSTTVFVSSGTPPFTYLWSDGQTTSNATGLAAGNYLVTITGGTGCTVTSDTITISAPGTIPPPVAGADATYCAGDSIADLTAAPGSGGSITWYSDLALTNVIGTGNTLTPDTVIGTTIYYVTETTGCEGLPDTVTITIVALPAAPAAGSDSTYCEGDPMADLTATPGSGGTITWYADAGLTTVLGTGPTLSPGVSAGTTVYYATESVGSCEGPADSVVITIDVCPSPTANFSASSIAICEAGCINFTDLSSSNTTAWSWSFPGAMPSTDTAQNPINICYATAGTYMVTLTASNSNGADTATTTIVVVSGPTVTASKDTIILLGETDTLTATGADTYMWSTGETGSIISVTPQTTTTYIVTGTDSLGCTGVDSVTVTVQFENAVFIPNVFSPNSGNLDNKQLYVFGTGITLLDLEIYDRWGERVFKTTETLQRLRFDGQCCTYGVGWDGTYKNQGKAVNSAVFAYILKVAFQDGTEVVKEGNITLIK